MSQAAFMKGLVIRSAAVRLPDVGYIYACDPEKEKEDVPHTVVFRWSSKGVQKADRNYNAHSVCVIEQPDLGYVDVSGQGYYTINIKSGATSADIFETSEPRPAKRRLGGIRSVAEIAKKAYAVGLRGMVYRLDQVKKWTRLDEGLPDTFEGQAIHGFGESDIYAVGREGQLWQFDGKKWTRRELPTNVNLTAVKCAGDGKVYVAGHGGLLLRGRDDVWEEITHEAMDDDVWDVEWFDGSVYVSTMHAVYRLDKNALNKVDFGADAPKSCYQLSAAPGVMWSNGEFDIMSFDGKRWTRVV
jgi:hypothetical protein